MGRLLDGYLKGSQTAQRRLESSQTRLGNSRINNSKMAWNYDYEIRRRSTRRHRSSRHVEYEYAPSSYRNRYRDPPYPTHYPDTYRTNITTLPNDIKLSVFDHLD